jgi:predicted nucleic acid-binding protein
VIRPGEAVFVDSGAWIGLALMTDARHDQALEQLELLQRAGARLHTSVPVVIETFTFLDRKAYRDIALSWKDSIHERGVVKILPCEFHDLQDSWEYFRRLDLRKLSAVDATSFAIMKRAQIRVAFTFDHHFAAAGFKLVA